jgi:hypothetical protein
MCVGEIGSHGKATSIEISRTGQILELPCLVSSRKLHEWIVRNSLYKFVNGKRVFGSSVAEGEQQQIDFCEFSGT